MSRPTISTSRPSSNSSPRSSSYEGTLLLVSHDRRLLDAVALTVVSPCRHSMIRSGVYSGDL